MDNTLVYLIGHQGVGKLTVARSLCKLTGASLVDNHLIANVVFGVIGADGKTPLPPRTWDLVERVREVAFAAMEELAPARLSYVLTNNLDDTPGDQRWFDRVVLAAERRSALFVPVVLTCDEDENMRRIPSPERAANMKHTDVESARAKRRAVRTLPIDHPNLITVETTSLLPEQSAATILAHVRGLAQRDLSAARTSFQ